MAYIHTIPEDEAIGKTKEIYESAKTPSGNIPNYVRLFSHRPEVYLEWENLLGSIRKHMRLRRYELVTLAAARKLECTYCMVAHGEILLNNSDVDEEQLAIIARDYHDANLTEEEIAIMEFSEKVIDLASSVTQADVDHLKTFGLSDEEILDITLAASARSFFSKTLDALNAIPDDKYKSLGAELVNALSVGRPFKDVE